MKQSTSGAILRESPDKFVKNVLLLKNGDFQRIGGSALMPSAREIAAIKATGELGQYKRNVEFFASMSEDTVKKKLEETFPYLKNKR